MFDDIRSYIPAHNIKWEEDAEGKVVLIKEKTRNRFIRKIIDFSKTGQEFRIKLDLVSSEVWKSIDSVKSVEEISNILIRSKGESFEQPQKRTASFIMNMYKNGFIELYTKNNT